MTAVESTASRSRGLEPARAARSAPVRSASTVERVKRLAPALVAAAVAISYVVISPPSLDLAAHLFRAQLVREEGFGLWNNFWYSGHHIVGYSVLFPAVSAELSPQLAAAIAATGTAAVFEPLARRHRRWLLARGASGRLRCRNILA